MAARAEEEARKALPEAAPAPAAAEPAAEAAPVEPAPAPDASSEMTAEAAGVETKEPAPAPAPAGESDAARAALEEAVSKATGISGDRLARLREALRAVGRDPANVRQVRVFTAEEEIPGARKVGEHQYVVDLMPESMRPTFGKPERERGRGHGGPRRGGGDVPLTGGFSMDAAKDDKKGQRRGPGGGPGGGPGRGPRGPRGAGGPPKA